MNAFLLEPNERFDPNSIKAWAPVHYLFTEGDRRCNPMRGQGFVEDVCHGLADGDYMPGKDWIVVTGPIAAVGLLMSAIMCFGTNHRLLVWDARARNYVERVIELGAEMDHSEGY